ncbi:MAG: flavodoxin domain-containing protein [Bacillota bacterium]|nr:flavodoxin domain-containing protein [Bacillota bacterium]
MLRNLTNSITYVGVDDKDLDLFEGQFIVPEGMAYNSYLIKSDKTAIMDSVDKHKVDDWFANIDEAMEGKSPDYLIVQHMEPDHSSSIEAFVNKYEGVTVVANKKTFKMISQFFPNLKLEKTIEVSNGDTLDLGSHTLSFLFAPMVHWPEVMMTYDSTDKVLFSADAFGKFGASDAEEDWACEARRYYFGIVGKFGGQVQPVLKKASELDIATICPLHGPVLDENLGYYLDLYDKWSSYTPEDKGVCICYTSVYGNTKNAVDALAEELKKQGEEIVEVSDLARCDWAEAVEDAFRYDRLVLATTTYNGDIFPFMRQFIDHLTERNYSNRKIGFVENGSWAPMAAKRMKSYLEECKDVAFAENTVTIHSSVKDENLAQIEALAKELVEMGNAKAEDQVKAEAPALNKYVCGICGYTYEGESLPEDFQCPLCKQGASVFEKQ